MIRTVSARLEVTVTEPARLAVQVAVAAEHADHLEETVSMTLDGNPVELLDVAAPVGGRIWVVDAARGALEIGYDATLTGVSTPPPDDIAAHLLYLRPSRYAESDRMVGFASRLFRDIGAPTDVLAAVSSWVGTQLEYVSGSSGPTDGAVDTLLAGRGVCRDFAHLAVVLLRAKQIPARLVAVYAPGLDPMDFHGVAEAFVDGLACRRRHLTRATRIAGADRHRP